MKILALDTATEACSVALSLDGEIAERFEVGRRHGERLLPMVQELLAEAGLALKQLDAVAFGRGPGSFTGIRIGVGVAQGLAYGADLPTIPISSLAALAQGADSSHVLAAFDARMQQVYWGAYVRGRDGLVTPAGDEIVVDPAQAPIPDGNEWIGIGSGWDTYHQVLAARFGNRIRSRIENRFPRASDVARLAISGVAIAAEQAQPVYLRNDVAVKSVGKNKPSRTA